MRTAPPRARAAGFRITSVGVHCNSRSRSATASCSTSTRKASSRRPTACALVSAHRCSASRATSSTLHPQSVSCGCVASSVFHAARSDGSLYPRTNQASASHGSVSRTSTRSRCALVRFCCARVENVPCNDHVQPVESRNSPFTTGSSTSRAATTSRCANACSVSQTIRCGAAAIESAGIASARRACRA